MMAADGAGGSGLVDYSPHVIDRILREIEMFETLAQSAHTSAHLLSPQCRHSEVGCSDGKPVGIKSTRSIGDPFLYVDLLADTYAAADSLPAYSIESQVVSRLITGRLGKGTPLEGALSDRIHQIRGELTKRYGDVWGAYHSACRMMARSLGWVEQAQPKDTPIAAGTK
jgi:hypothetical protein